MNNKHDDKYMSPEENIAYFRGVDVSKNKICRLRAENKRLKHILKEIKQLLNCRIEAFERREALGEGYELTEVMQIELACDRRMLKQIQQIERECVYKNESKR